MTGLVIDASVFLSAIFKQETGHAQSRDFLAVLQRDAVLHYTAFAILEVAASVFRRTHDQRSAERVTAIMLSLTDHPRMHAMDGNGIGSRLPGLLYRTGLRAADLVYVALADYTGSTLITLDYEMLSRSESVVRALTPGQFSELP